MYSKKPRTLKILCIIKNYLIKDKGFNYLQISFLFTGYSGFTFYF